MEHAGQEKQPGHDDAGMAVGHARMVPGKCPPASFLSCAMFNTPLVRVCVGAIIALSLLVTLVPARAQSLAHEKYSLENGLTVILHEDRSLPAVSINLWYRVGAQNEPPGRSGFAHLFEHLMFMGTRRVPGNAFDVLMETGGGSNNASTSLDRTNYFSVGPSELLPTLLWLDADRLEDMGVTMTQAKLDLQRDVVRNERRQTVENEPYGKAYEASYQLLYPASHPYHNGIIGTHADLEAATVQDVQDFFATFYTPGNCSLVVAGDFDAAAIKPLIAQLFGTLPRGNAPGRQEIPAAKLSRVVRNTSLDAVELPKIMMSFHSPGAYQPGDAEATLLSRVLADGPGSRLYDRLVLGEELAVDVGASQDAAMLGSVFRVEVTAKPDASLARIEAIVDEELARIVKEGPTEDELARRRAIIEVGKIASLQSLQARADQLNEYEFYFGTPDGLARDLARFKDATPQRVQRVASGVLTLDARVVQVVLPSSPAPGSSARETRPDAAPSRAFVPAEPEIIDIGGVPVMLWSRPAASGGLPLVSATLMLVQDDPQGLEPAALSGVTSLAMDMLSEGTGEMDGPAFASALQSLGASMGASASTQAANVSLSGLSRTFPQAVSLWTSALRSPRMSEVDFARVKGLQLQQLAQSEENPGVVSRRVAMRTLMGDASPYGRLMMGTPETVASLTHAQLTQAHARALKGRAVLLIAGDLTAQQARDLFTPALKGLAGLDITGSTPLAAIAPPAAAPLRLFIVDRAGAPQTMVMFASPGASMSNPSRVELDHLAMILGGSFTSRLNQNLREKNGFTYGARAAFSMAPSLGWFEARAAVQTEVTGAALNEFMSEFNRIRSGDITADETQKAALSIRQDVVGDFATLDGILGQAAARAASGLSFATIATDLSHAGTITPQALNTLAKSAITTDQGVLILVGDKAAILPQLEAVTGLPKPTIVDAYGNEVK